jgi:hypothetical protein
MCAPRRSFISAALRKIDLCMRGLEAIERRRHAKGGQQDVARCAWCLNTAAHQSRRGDRDDQSSHNSDMHRTNYLLCCNVDRRLRRSMNDWLLQVETDTRIGDREFRLAFRIARSAGAEGLAEVDLAVVADRFRCDLLSARVVLLNLIDLGHLKTEVVGVTSGGTLYTMRLVRTARARGGPDADRRILPRNSF